MNNQRGFTLPEFLGLGMIIVGIALFIGWCMNLYAVITQLLADSPITSMLVLRGIGIFFGPLGGILGYF